MDKPPPCLSCICNAMNAIKVRSTFDSCQFSSRRAARSNALTLGAQAIASNSLWLRLSCDLRAFQTSMSLDMTCSGSSAGCSFAAVKIQATGFTSMPNAGRPMTTAVNGPFPRPQNGSRTVSPGFVRLPTAPCTKAGGNIAKYLPKPYQRPAAVFRGQGGFKVDGLLFTSVMEPSS